MADIDVQLYLAATKDIERLVEALHAFSGSAQSLEGGGPSGKKGGAGPAVTGTSHGLRSRMSPADANQYDQMHGIGRAVMGDNWGQTGRTGGLLSRVAGIPGLAKTGRILKGGYDELPGGNLVQKVGWGLAFGPQTLSTLGGLAQGVGNLAFGGGFTQAGTQMGLSNSGPLGLGVGSQAWQQGVLNSLYASIHGIANPYVKQGMGLAAQSGFNPRASYFGLGGPSNAMSGRMGMAVSGMAANALKNGATDDVVSQWIESLRYGSTNLAQLNGRIKDLANLSKAAHMSVGGFTSQLQATADQMQQNLGVTNFQAGKQVAALSSATGLAPELIGQVTSDKSNMWLAVASAGGDPYAALQGNHGGVNEMNAFGMKILGVIGAQTWQQGAQMIGKSGSPGYKEAWNRLWYAYQAGMIPMPPQQAITLITRMGRMKNTKAGYSAMFGLQSLSGQSHVNQKTFNRTISQLRSSGILPAHVIDSIVNKDHSDPAQAVQDLMAKVGMSSGGLTDQAAQGNVTKVELTGYAKKLFQIDKSSSNAHPASAGAAAVRNIGIR